MLREYVLYLLILTLFVLAPQQASATNGAFYIEGNRCWCATTTYLNDWNAFPVSYVPNSQSDCANPLQAAFRIVGVPDDPALQRRFEPWAPMEGDVFGEGARFTSLGPHPGELTLGTIRVYLTEPLPTQVWSIEAHQGIQGVITPVMEFDSPPGIWTPQAGHSLTIGTPAEACDSCLPPYAGCPFAVEEAIWSTIKQLYQ